MNSKNITIIVLVVIALAIIISLFIWWAVFSAGQARNTESINVSSEPIGFLPDGDSVLSDNPTVEGEVVETGKIDVQPVDMGAGVGQLPDAPVPIERSQEQVHAFDGERKLDLLVKPSHDFGLMVGQRHTGELLSTTTENFMDCLQRCRMDSSCIGGHHSGKTGECQLFKSITSTVGDPERSSFRRQ